MKKQLLFISLFVAVSSVFAQTFVPTAGVYYNVVQNTSSLVLGPNGTQPVVQTLTNTAAQAFRFVPVAGLTDTYYIQNLNGQYFSGNVGNNYTTLFESAPNSTVARSQWVISGADASNIRLMVKSHSKYIASDQVITNSILWSDKTNTNANGLFTLAPATVTPAITSEKSVVLEIEKDLKAYPVYVSATNFAYNVNISVPTGYTATPSTITPQDFTNASGKVKVDINSTASVGDTAKIIFTYTNGAATFKLDSVRATPIATYNRYYLTHKTSGYAIGGLATNYLFPALTAKAKALTQRLIFRRANPKVIPNDSVYYVIQDGDYRMLRKTTTSNWDTEFGLSGNEAKWRLKLESNGTYSLTNAVTAKALGTDNTNLEGRLYDDKVFKINATSAPYCEWIVDDVNALDVSKATLTFDNLNKTKTFNVFGTAVTNNVTLVAPAGINLSKTTLTAAEVQTGITITATFDNVTIITAGTITVSSPGQTTKTISVKSSVDAGCFTPLYSDRTNLVADPYINSLDNFAGWGAKSINTDLANVYCGSNSGMISGGSLDVLLTGIIKPATTYRMKAMIKASNVTCNIGIYGHSSSNIADIVAHPTTTGAWEAVELVFTTGATLEAGDQGIFFNNASGSYIDNWELYEVPTPVTAVVESSVSAFASVVGSNQQKTITLSGSNLLGNVSLAITGTNADQFSVNPATLTAVSGNVSSTAVTITYTPTAASVGHVATLTITSAGATDKVFALSGSASSTSIAKNVNTNWNASVSTGKLKVTGVDSFDVYSVEGSKVAQITANSLGKTVTLHQGIYVVKTVLGVQKVIVK